MAVAAWPRFRSTLVPWYPDDLLPRIRQVLGELADIEFRYEAEWNRLQASEENDADRQCRSDELARRYRQERKPCLERLARLQCR
jgi:hypothetical protein